MQIKTFTCNLFSLQTYGNKRRAWQILKMNTVYPDNLFQNTFFPQPGITVRYLKIPAIVDFIFSTAPDPNYKTMANRSFGATDFKIAFLSGEELATVNGFKAQKKQIEWMCGRFSLKTLANEILSPGVPLADIQVSYQKKGAPFLNAYPDTPISLSHSGDYTAVSLGQNRQRCRHEICHSNHQAP